MSLSMEGFKQRNGFLTVEAGQNVRGALVDKRQKRYDTLKKGKRFIRKDIKNFKDEMSTFDVKC